MRNTSPQSPADWLPDARGQAVLAAIINEHLVTGEPVGSRAVAAAFAAAWSPATIRNVMAELEEAGLVEQPHTSAGRVPTDKGYRFYVDHLIGGAHLTPADHAAIDRTLAYPRTDDGATPARLMEKVSHLLSDLTHNVGIVISPALAGNRLQHIEFVSLADGRILVVLVFAPGLVQHKVIRIDEPLTQEELERTARYLNVEFSGKSLLAIRAEILQRMCQEKALYDRLLRTAMLLCGSSLVGEELETGDVYVDGASHILDKPDFADLERLRELFRTLEEKTRLVKILNECLAGRARVGDVHVRIGRELTSPAMRACALISAPYRVGAGEVSGTISVFGPMRLEYARLMAVVGYVAQQVERMLQAEGASA
ncbi:MAG TPA: heat-inducible transcriptional repressor HrcA [Pyrinomonadaceae bacterium]|jgi:heat-inducible transcriptional repressor